MTKEKDKVMLQVQLDPELKDKIEAAATLQGVSMSAWVRQAAEHCLPKSAATTAQGQDAMDKAFDELDKAENEQSNYPGVMPLPPTAAVASPPVAQAAPMQTPGDTEMAPFVMEHSCAHLLVLSASNFARGQCQGSCTTQGNRDCHWASHIANQCPAFRSKRSRIPPRSPMR